MKKHAAIVLKHAGPASRSASLHTAGRRGAGARRGGRRSAKEEEDEKEMSF